MTLKISFSKYYFDQLFMQLQEKLQLRYIKEKVFVVTIGDDYSKLRKRLNLAGAAVCIQ